jgi:hypothetical protein
MDLTSSINPKISQMLTRILLIVVIACSGAVIYGLSEIDKIINVKLYDYGLQPNDAWLNPYHNFAWIIYGALGATILVSVMVLALGFLKPKEAPRTSFKPQTTPSVVQTPPPAPIQTQPKIQEEPKPIPAPTITRQKPQAEKEEKKPKTTNKQSSTSTSSNVNGVCPACKKPYTQSLVMLDFEDGKSKLVNVCPNCNHVLGDSEQKTQ